MAKNEDKSLQYQTLEGVPGKYFTCPSYSLMSVGSCVRNFTEAPGAVRSGRLQKCIGCEHGRVHAGAPKVEAAPKAQQSLQYRPVCCRCRRDGTAQGTRLLGRMRLVRAHTICVSCFNREKEVIAGRNSKGAKPKKWGGLFYTRAAYVEGGRAFVVDLTDPVIDRAEVALTMIRRGHKSVVWARPAVTRGE
ncbi:hypothetical protein PQR39_35295 [Paraburkholderia sediminicola]|uniref:hypothetical protein n=1 Tax=Paraburkholderia sediminicola TaxID=458836 RepID=UPI0038B9C0AC